MRGALDALRADRLLHGIRAIEDDALVAELVERGTCLDVCPTSNVVLSVVPSLAAHPLPALLEAGVRCSINADDPLVFGPGCREEYELCRTELGLSDEQAALRKCTPASIRVQLGPRRREGRRTRRHHRLAQLIDGHTRRLPLRIGPPVQGLLWPAAPRRAGRDG